MIPVSESPPSSSKSRSGPPVGIDGSTDAETRLTIIEPRRGRPQEELRELWRYRELLFILMWRDITVRYKQTVLGIAWAVLQPLATMVVFSVFFSRMASTAPESTPYPLFVFTGLLPWFFFSNAITSAGQSVVGSQSLVTKIYFPRMLIPLGAVGACLVDFGLSFAMLLMFMIYYGVLPGWGLLLIPVLTFGLAVAAQGIGALLAALTVAYRDFRHAIPFMVQLWMFATPAIYVQGDAVGPRGAWLMPLNPTHGLILNFRAATLGGNLDLYALTVSLAVSLVLLIVGCAYFRRVERQFADII